MGVSLGVDGWTIWTQSSPSGQGSGFSGAGTREIYCSFSTGNDANPGTFAQPKKTISAAEALLRNGFPDWLLVKKTDTWTAAFSGGKSGKSATEPMIYGCYDPAIAGVVDPPSGGALPIVQVSAGQIGISWISTSTSVGSFVALVGIDFYAFQRDPGNPSFNANTGEVWGWMWLSRFTWCMVEDCTARFCSEVDFMGNGGSIVSGSVAIMRRSRVLDAYSNDGSHSQGVYCEYVSQIDFQENTFDHNGWNASVSGAGAVIYNHNVYIQVTNGPSIFKNNITSRPSSHGCQLRAGGEMSNNLFLQCPLAGFVAGGELGGSAVASTVADNVVLQASDIDGSNPRGSGLSAEYTHAPGQEGFGPNNSQFLRNVLAHSDSTHSDWLGGLGVGDGSPVITGIAFFNNVMYKWGGPMTPLGQIGTWYVDDSGGGNPQFPTGGATANQMSTSNTFGYPAPERSIATYDASVGGPGTLANFYSVVRTQHKQTWNTNYTAIAANNYIRTGFGLAPIGGGGLTITASRHIDTDVMQTTTIAQPRGWFVKMQEAA